MYLLVEETVRGFDVDICVNDEMENIYDAIGKTNDPLLKTNLLKDTYIINEIYPKFNDTLSLNENLELNLDDFTNFFFFFFPLFEVMGLKIILPKSLQKRNPQKRIPRTKRAKLLKVRLRRRKIDEVLWDR